ncbi:MAG TPA: carbonic anhydrase [Polyangia bacterium]|nr:carbonic anhydrase [Polyangia bacterium]
MPRTWDPSAIDPETGLARLIEGNRRFVAGKRRKILVTPADVSEAQQPFACIVGCSDSRVPVETVLDQGVGDLFVIRVAGHVINPSQIGSVEFAVSQFGTRLVLVLGHTRCGAVTATLRTLIEGETPESRHIAAITDRIAPNITPLLSVADPAKRLEQAVVANVRASMSHLCHGSQSLDELTRSGRVQVRGAVYHLDTGMVEILDGDCTDTGHPTATVAAQ